MGYNIDWVMAGSKPGRTYKTFFRSDSVDIYHQNLHIQPMEESPWWCNIIADGTYVRRTPRYGADPLQVGWLYDYISNIMQTVLDNLILKSTQSLVLSFWSLAYDFWLQ